MADYPWNRNEWCGGLISLDGTPTTDFTEDDVESVVAYGETSHDSWTGQCAGIALLRDGRFISWESWWDVTGTGFCGDAYGGTADIAFAATRQIALTHISEVARETLEWTA